MDAEELLARRRARHRERQRRRRRRWLALACLSTAAVAIVAVVLLGARGGGGSVGSPAAAAAAKPSSGAAQAPVRRRTPSSTVAPGARGTGHPAEAAIPILMYHVIADPPAGAPFPGLYVPVAEFRTQMQALAAAGWHAVTMDQARAHWTRGVALGPGKPIVLSFDNGYQSQYTAARPILDQLGWVGVENLQLTGLPPSQGGLTRAQVRGLLLAGWELDTQGVSHADLVSLDGAELRAQVAGARATMRQRFHVGAEWFCYPSGQYDARVVAAVRAAGYVGSTTVVPGWSRRASDPYRLPRLRVLGGTSPASLLGQISQARGASPPPPAYRT